ASETWLQVTRDLPGFSGSYDGFRGWVATIARHRALDHLRRTARRPALPVPADDLALEPANRAAGVAGHTALHAAPPAGPPPAPPADTAQPPLDAVATGHAVALIAPLPPDQAEAVLLRA